MKFLPSTLLALAGLGCTLSVSNVRAQAAAPPTSATPQSQNSSVQISPASAEVLKLVQAKVGENVITAYIAASAKVYPLTAAQIIYLKDAGVSDRVLTAMMNQRARVPATPAVTERGAQGAPSQMPTPGQSTAQAPPVYPPAPSSSVYVIPYPTTYSSYYAYPFGDYPYSYYGGYWPYSSYYYPGFSFSIGYNWGYPRYGYGRYPYSYPYHAARGYYGGGFGRYPWAPYRGGYSPRYPYGSGWNRAVGPSSRYVGATGGGGFRTGGFYPRGTYIGATGMGGYRSSAFHSPGTYVGATGRGGFSAPAARMGGGGFSGSRMGGGGFRGGGHR